MKAKAQLRVTLPPRTIKARTLLARSIGQTLPGSAFVQAHPEVEASGTNFVNTGVALEGAEADAKTLHDKWIASCKVRDGAFVAHNLAADHFVSTVLMFATTIADVHEAGLTVAEPVKHPLSGPAEVFTSYDVVTHTATVWIDAVPGVRAHRFRHSADPITATSWVHVDGVGTKRELKDLPAGLHWFEVNSMRGDEETEFVGPVALLIKP